MNLLQALKNLSQTHHPGILHDYSQGENRTNSMGDPLEKYIEDLFCNFKYENNLNTKHKIISQTFSYIGNNNNPPDLMLKGGDAIEIKKITDFNSPIALNSSYPKNKLYSTDPMITHSCKTAEDWIEKDFIYVVGVVPKKEKKLRALWFVHGECYAATPNTYERIKNTISKSFQDLEGIEFSKTNELGRVNKVDPLGITSLRIRGMWNIENPNKLFQNITSIEKDNELTVNAIILEEKYKQFPLKDRSYLENNYKNGILVKDVKIPSPNNPANLLEAKLIKINKN